MLIVVWMRAIGMNIRIFYSTSGVHISELSLSVWRMAKPRCHVPT